MNHKIFHPRFSWMRSPTKLELVNFLTGPQLFHGSCEVREEVTVDLLWFRKFFLLD